MHYLDFLVNHYDMSIPNSIGIFDLCCQFVYQQGLAGYSDCEDTQVYSFHKDNNYGSYEYFSEYGSYESLFRFKNIFLSEGGFIPDSAKIISARAYIYKYTSYNYTFDLHRILVDWDEGQATWNNRLTGTPWNQGGCNGVGSDIATDPDDRASIGWSPNWISWDVIDSIKAFQGGADNYGWKMQGISGNNNWKKFRSSEYSGDINYRPKLLIEYNSPYGINIDWSNIVDGIAGGKATKYNGVDESTLMGIICPLKFDKDDFSIFFWVNIEDHASAQTLLADNNVGSNNKGIEISYRGDLANDPIRVEMNDGSSSAFSLDFNTDGLKGWNQIGFVADRDNTGQIILNGEVKAEASISSYQDSISSNRILAIAKQSEFDANFFKGRFDSLSFFKKALDIDEKRDLFKRSSIGLL